MSNKFLCSADATTYRSTKRISALMVPGSDAIGIVGAEHGYRVHVRDYSGNESLPIVPSGDWLVYSDSGAFPNLPKEVITADEFEENWAVDDA